jgi:Txe/YoeB family toxin of Txe-Axe toxin-antitoxin module
MVLILPVSQRVRLTIKKHRLEKKFTKQQSLLSQNPGHPSLHVEILEPRWRGIYSFRIDRKYRALFIFRIDKQAIEIFAITVHYR